MEFYEKKKYIELLIYNIILYIIGIEILFLL